MVSTSDFQRYTTDFRHDPFEMPPLIFPPSPPGRSRAVDASSPRLPSHTRAFSYSPQPSFADRDYPPSFVSCHSHSDLGCFLNSRFDDDAANRYLPHAAIEEFLDESLMAAHYLDLPTHCSSTDQDLYSQSYQHSDSSASSPEAAETSSSTSPRAELLSTHSSPGYLMRDLPDEMKTPRRHSGFGRTPQPQRYDATYDHHGYIENNYRDDLVLPRPASFHEPPMHHRSANNWGYPPSTLPSMFHRDSRYAMTRTPSPSNPHPVHQFPVAEDLRRWPQMFKVNQVKKTGAKKQMMACLFCRARKIGCSRPSRGRPRPDVQCARRKRKCQYPTESRRGQHTRNRQSSKKFLGLEEPRVAPVTPPKLHGTG
ncbi:hypothetical protein B0H14DRAFT_3429187 [Mycena olivaceomarginata]|nr:hypothetical protein B0H14DRAFT_3429187 [Mycena olivaceomarginata]